MNTNTKRSWITNIILIIYFLKHDYDVWLKIKNRLIQLLEKVKKKESVDLSDMLSLEGDEEVKERKILKISTPKKLLTRLVILLNKNWKQFLQIKKLNQTNTTSFVSAQ